MSQVILITGGAGFVGSNLAFFLKDRHKDYRIICLDNLYRAGSELNVKRLSDVGIQFIRADIRDKEELFNLPKIDCLIECSAEPSVMKSYENPLYTIETNLGGTINCFELAKRDQAQVVYLSTSRVYPFDKLNQIPCEEHPTRYDLSQTEGVGYSHQGITLDFSTQGAKSLYGATKLCSEQLLTEYLDMYAMKGVINRFGVIAGAWQMGRIDQGIVGYWLYQHILERPLSYIGFQGEGKQVRDVIHIDDVCELISYQLAHMDACNGQVFNVGGGRDNATSLSELTELAKQITGKSPDITSDQQQRKGDVRIYITDNSDVTQKTGWSPQKDLLTICTDTFVWMDAYKDELMNIL